MDVVENDQPSTENHEIKIKNAIEYLSGRGKMVACQNYIKKTEKDGPFNKIDFSEKLKSISLTSFLFFARLHEQLHPVIGLEIPPSVSKFSPEQLSKLRNRVASSLGLEETNSLIKQAYGKKVEDKETGKKKSKKNEQKVEPEDSISIIETPKETVGFAEESNEKVTNLTVFPEVIEQREFIKKNTPSRYVPDFLFLLDNFGFFCENGTCFEWKSVKGSGFYEETKRALVEQRFRKLWEDESDHEWHFQPPEFLVENPERWEKENAKILKIYFSWIEKTLVPPNRPTPFGFNFANGFLLLPVESSAWAKDSLGKICNSKDFFSTDIFFENYQPKAILSIQQCELLMTLFRNQSDDLALFRLYSKLAARPRVGIQSGLLITGPSGTGKGASLRLIKKICRSVSVTSKDLILKELPRLYGANSLLWFDADPVTSDNFQAIRSLLGRDTPFRGTIIVATSLSSTQFFEKGGSSIRDRFFTLEFFERGENPLNENFEQLLYGENVSGLINWIFSVPEKHFASLIRSGSFNTESLEDSHVGGFVIENLVVNAQEFVSTKTVWDCYKQYCLLNDLNTIKRSAFDEKLLSFLNVYCDIEKVRRVRRSNTTHFEGFALRDKEKNEPGVAIKTNKLNFSPYEIDNNCYLKAEESILKQNAERAERNLLNSTDNKQ